MAYALIIDADLARTGLYQPLVEAQGLEAVRLRDPEAAREAIEERGPPALVLTELSLPKVDGFAFLKALRERFSPEQVAVVVVSAFRALRNEAMQRRSELGIHALLPASAPLSSVERAIESALAGVTLPTTPERPTAAEERLEQERIENARALGMAEEGPDQQTLQQIVEQTAREFGVPISLVSVVLEDRQWFKAHVGLGGELLADRGTPRDWAFCEHVVQSRTPLFVPDAAAHPTFVNNPLVRQGLVRSYLGAPLVSARDEVLGTLCIIDSKPRQFTAADSDALIAWSRRVAGELLLRSPERDAGVPIELVRQAVAEREADARLLQALLDHLDEGLLLMNERREVLFANVALGTLFQVEPRSLRGMGRDEWLSIIASRAASPEAIPRQMLAPIRGPFAARDELVLSTPAHRVVRWTAKPFRLGKQIGHLATFVDVTAERQLAEQREQLALTDLLTGALNRRGAEEAIRREVARARREGKPLSFAFIDVDHFKKANDEHGHAFGDEVLRAVVQCLQNAVRASDLVARWGGDEFVVVLPGANLDQARQVAEKARKAVEELWFGNNAQITLSIGTAELGEGEKDASQAFARADEAVYAAKAAGRNTVR